MPKLICNDCGDVIGEAATEDGYRKILQDAHVATKGRCYPCADKDGTRQPTGKFARGASPAPAPTPHTHE